MAAPLLVFGVGNPSRGDDALGPLFIERTAVMLRSEIDEGQVELLTDFQLQIEHALDLTGRKRVVFVDATTNAEAPFRFDRVEARRDESFSSHALSPAAVLDAHRAIVGAPPSAWVLAIRGHAFTLGDGLSPEAAGDLESALRFFVDRARSLLRA